jgi:hypothetical protein
VIVLALASLAATALQKKDWYRLERHRPKKSQ